MSDFVEEKRRFMQFGRILAALTSTLIAVSFPVCVQAETDPQPHHTHHIHHHKKTAEETKKSPEKKTARKPRKSERKAQAAPHGKVEKQHAAQSSSSHHRRHKVEHAEPKPQAGDKKAEAGPVQHTAAAAPRLRSSAYLVQDLQSGTVLLQKNAEDVQPMASLTKLMTAMVVLDAHQPMDEVLEVTDDDVDRLKHSVSHLTIGTTLTRRDMLHLALMASENRAASALARNYPGGLRAFLAAANAKARQLGLHATHYDDATGLNKNNVSNARELAVILATASRYPLIHEFTTSTELTVTLKSGAKRDFHNTDALVKNAHWDIDVSKTGHITESGQCLALKAHVIHKSLAIVLLNSPTTSSRLEDAVRVRDWLRREQPTTAQARSSGTNHS